MAKINGKALRKLREERGLSLRDLQKKFMFQNLLFSVGKNHICPKMMTYLKALLRF